MNIEIVAKRYAVALFELVQDNKEQVQSELISFQEAIQDNKSFISLLSSPALSIAQKKDMMKTIVEGASPAIQNTFFLLIDQGREALLLPVIEKTVDLINESNGVAVATAISSRPLSDNELQEVSKVFAQKVGKQSLQITNEIDPSILGGLKVRIGNTIFDGSLQGKLNRLQDSLLASN